MISRRRLITSGALLAGGLVVGFSIPGVMRLRSGPRLAPPLGDPGWIHIAPDETVTLYSTRVEMGQGAWTALAQIVNEELEADFARVRIQMASPGATFTKPVGFATQNSSSVQRIFAGMRSIGAAARQMLIETAAQDWNVPPAECRVANGVVLHESSGRKATYGSLAPRAAGREVPGDPPLKKRDQWQLIGKSVPRIESAGTVDGSARYTMDLQFPEMLSAAVSQSLFSGSRIASIDRAAALASPGVLRIVELGEAVAVVARNYWSASRGLTRARVA